MNHRIYLKHNRTSACCALEQTDEHPRGWGKGVCNTPLHALTQYTDVVLVGELLEFGEFVKEVGCLLLEDLEFACAEMKDEASFGHEDGVGGGCLLPEGACAADIAFWEFGDPCLHGAAL